MSYNDFWFVETRIQTNNLKRYFLYFIIIFAFVSIGTYMAIKTMYKDIQAYEIQATNPTVTVSEAKATNVNGYIRGEVINEGEEDISDKYLLFLLCNKNNEVISREYINIGTVFAGQTKTYELKFKQDNVERFYVAVTDVKNKN